MRIVKLTAENVKRIVAVEIAPTGELVVVGGKNDAGKSSALDAIEMALGGEKHTPPQPVRRGAKAARIVLDLGDLVVTRTFTAAGGRKLVVASKDGAEFRSPQAMLDRLYGALAFDPLQFERMEPKQQAETLRRLVGLDLADLDAERQRLYDERTMANREVKALEVQVAATEVYLGVPDVEVSLDALSGEMLEAERCRRLADDAEREAEKAREALVRHGEGLRATAGRVRALEEQLQDAWLDLAAYEKAIADGEREVDARQITAQAALAVVPDVQAIRQRLSEAEGINVQVRHNRQHALAEAEHERAKAEAQAFTTRIDGVDAQKAARLAAVAMPVPGLGIDGEGVTLDGLPFEQASTSDRIRVSVAIGLAGNPQLKVLLVRDGSLLGPEKLAILAEMAKATGTQIWIEMLQQSADGTTTVYIEDGTVQPPAKRLAMSQAQGI